MGEEDDFLHIVEDAEAAPEEGPRWVVAVIDDDPAVHDGTRFALGDYQLNGQRLEILSAFSAAEGRELLRAHPDVAAILLDVIMETDNAGLDLVHFIRDALKNFEAASRMVLPGVPMKSRLLTMPLTHEAGGTEFHPGGKHLESQSDPEWKALADWVNRAK